MEIFTAIARFGKRALNNPTRKDLFSVPLTRPRQRRCLFALMFSTQDRASMRQSALQMMALCLLWFGASALPEVLPAQAPSGCRIPGFPAPTLCERSGLDTLAASYIIVVDESKSMQPLWPAVREALGEFTAAIQTGDQLEVVLFSSNVRTLIPPTPASSQSRAAWTRSISSLSSPNGTSTDLGRASEAIVSRLQAAPAGQLQFVFLLTDGKHEPPPGSPFPPSGGGAFIKLGASASALMSVRLVSLEAVRLAPSADLSLLENVFPNLTTVQAYGATGLTNWFQSASRQVAIQKLKLLIDRDLSRPAWTLVSKGEISTQNGVKSSYEVEAHSGRALVTTALANPGPYALPKGAIISFPSGIDPARTPSTKVLITGQQCAWWKPPGRCGSFSGGQLNVKTRLEPALELSRIGVNPDVRPDSVRLELSVVGGGSFPGFIYYPLVLLLVSVVGATLVRLRWAMYRPKLYGRVIYTPSGASFEPTPVRFASMDTNSYLVTSPTGEELLRLDARAERGRSVVYATPGKTEVQVNGKKVVGPQRVDRTARFQTPDGDIHFFTN